MNALHCFDCTIYYGPALKADPYDSGALQLTIDPAEHRPIALFIPWAGNEGLLMNDVSGKRFVEPQKLPADRLITDASAPDLPSSHDPMAFFG
jgi:hypothetical protein